MKAVISLRDVVVSRGNGFRLVIDQLDFQPRRIYSLTGPNGAGKSTLLRTLALLEPPESGVLQLCGKTIRRGETNLHQYRRQVTLVEQFPYLLCGTVAHNLAFGLKLRGISGAELQRKIDNALALVGLEGFAMRRAEELSGGEAQRVALARALALDPAVLLLDEPTANVDRRSLLAIEEVIGALPERGVTVILATHDLALPSRLQGEVISLVDGRLCAQPHCATEFFSPPLKEQRPWLHPLNAQGA